MNKIWVYRLVTYASLTLAAKYSSYFQGDNNCWEFRANDKTISLPYRPETITSSQLIKVSLVTTALLAIWIEFERHYSRGGSVVDIILNAGKALKAALWDYYLLMLCGLFWAGTILWATKINVGRPRPCFLDKCQLPSEYHGSTEILTDAACLNRDLDYFCQSFFSG